MLNENELLCVADIVKGKLAYVYTLSCESTMAKEMMETIDVCNSTKNRHFVWFSRFL